MDIIHDVTRRGDVRSLREILATNPGFPLADQKFSCFLRTPLHVAALLDYVDFAKEIVRFNPRHGSQLAMETDSQGCTPLHLASTRNNLEMVSVLLNANTDACIAPDNHGGTPLHLAAMRDEVKVMDLLIQSRPEAIHQRLRNTNDTILHLCVKHDKFKALKWLIDHLVTNRANLANNPDAISVNSVDSGGNTILHLAAKMNRNKMLKYLLNRGDIGVDTNIRNNEEITALHMLGRNEMKDMGISCYDYHNTREVPQQSKSNEWLKERLNTIMIVAALIAGIAFQAGTNPPGGVFQEDMKMNSTEDPVMFSYYLRNIIHNRAMSRGFQSYLSRMHNLPPHLIARGGNNITADEIITYRANFVKELLTAAKTSDSNTRLAFFHQELAPGIVLEEDSWRNFTFNYNTTYGGGSGFSPYLIHYAGTAILAYASPKAFQAYIILNNLSLVLCGMTILLITFDGIKQRPSASTTSIVGFLEVLLANAVACVGLSYMVAVQSIGPPFHRYLRIFTNRFILLFPSVVLPIASITYHIIFIRSTDPLAETRIHGLGLRYAALRQLFLKLYNPFQSEENWLVVKLLIFQFAFVGICVFILEYTLS
ncbi:uncharacterized protein LOC113328431 [Papaver somniferum]|uniref:uncharacterized protein LOC113328431 n=1 Tax=Papaver somniferum TaxID=3469 RepID=UPI000E6FBE57|nr:uncharacterized protein LOC113328431 [Papaver somniferum]